MAMWLGFAAAAAFLIALIVNIAVKGSDVKYALDFAYLGGIFLGLTLGVWLAGWGRRAAAR